MLASRLASSSSRWVTGNSTRIGVSLTTVASTPELGLTRLPGDTAARPMRPAIGDLIVGVGELDLGIAQLGLGVLEVRLGLELFGEPLVVGLLGAGVGAQQLGGALELEIGVGERGLRGVALGDLLVDRGLVGLGLDGEDDLVHLHHVAVGELARPEESLDPGAQLDLVDRGGPADEFGLVGDRRQLGGLHEDSRRPRPAVRSCRLRKL